MNVPESKKHKPVSPKVEAKHEVERYRKLIDNVDDFVIMSDENGLILAANRKVQDVLGYTEEELRSFHTSKLVHEEDLFRSCLVIQEALKEERTRGLLKLVSKSGRIIPTEVVATFSKEDRTIQAIFRDISERLGMERELQRRTEQLELQNRRVLAATKQKNRFFASMSHELRTPMTSIIGFTEVLLEDDEEPLKESQRQQLMKVTANAHRLLEMINELLDLSKIEAGRMTLSLSKVCITQLVDQAIMSINPLIRGKDVRLEAEVEQDLPVLYTDEQKLGQILTNLLSNAVKFTPQGVVTVCVNKVRGNMLLTVSDTGCGIRRSDFKHVFEEFYQVECAGTKKHSGTGLGLTIAKRLTYLLGGDMKVASKVGKGSAFTVILPFAPSRSLLTRRSKTAGFF